MTGIMMQQEDSNILIDGLKDLTIDQLKLVAILGAGKLAGYLLGSPKEDFQSGLGALGVAIHLIAEKANFELAEITKDSRVYSMEELAYLLAKSSSQIAQGDLYYGCAETEYWLKYIVNNFAEKVG